MCSRSAGASAAEALPEQQRVFVTVIGGIEQVFPDEPVTDQVERRIGPDAQEVQGDPLEHRVVALLKSLDDPRNLRPDLLRLTA